MICPACKNDMIVVEHEDIELDYCTNCNGVWFDSGELELLLEAAGLESPQRCWKRLVWRVRNHFWMKFSIYPKPLHRRKNGSVQSAARK